MDAKWHIAARHFAAPARVGAMNAGLFLQDVDEVAARIFEDGNNYGTLAGRFRFEPYAEVFHSYQLALNVLNEKRNPRNPCFEERLLINLGGLEFCRFQKQRHVVWPLRRIDRQPSSVPMGMSAFFE